MKTLGALTTALALFLVSVPATAQDQPILVVDKCPEFCPKPPDVKNPKMCTMALIPVPKKKYWYWKDGCKTKMVYIPPLKKGNR